MKELKLYSEKTFDDIKHIDENGNEYWLARELQIVLDYKKWQKFINVIENAKAACEQSKFMIDEHFTQVGKTSKMPNGGVKNILEYKLSRYACYLIVQNADPKKEVVALGQTYFAVQTRKAELTEEYLKQYEDLSEDEKRLRKRKEIKTGNLELNKTAKDAGVKNFGEFHNAGYKGLYNGETADDIAKRKGLRYREEILDNMCSDELIANQFRISLAKQKIINENIKGEKNARAAHYKVGTIIRNSIKEAGGTMPEEFATPKKSLKELKKEELRKIDGGYQNLTIYLNKRKVVI